MESIEEKHTKNAKKKTHPEAKHKFLIYFPFCWEVLHVLKNLNRSLNVENAYTSLPEHSSKELGKKLSNLWREEENFHQNPSLFRPLARMIGLKFLISSILYVIIYSTYTLYQPQLLKKLLDYHTYGQTNITKNEAYLTASGMLLLAFFRSFGFHLIMRTITNLGIKIRIACNVLIYKKCLKLDKQSFQTVSMGQIINLLTNDTNHFVKTLNHMNFLWIGFIECIVAAYYLEVTYGHEAIVGFGVIFFYITYIIFVYKRIFLSRKLSSEKTDFRICQMNEVISGIRVIKINTWENLFKKIIETIRESEIIHIFKETSLRFVVLGLNQYVTKLMFLLFLLITTIYNIPLTPQYVFVVLMTYGSIRRSAFALFSTALFDFLEAKIAFERIHNFFLIGLGKRAKSTKKNDKCVLISRNLLEKDKFGVSITNICVKWDYVRRHEILKDITFEASPGSLTGIIGAAGSGKSTLFQAILKEVPVIRGNILVGGAVSYTSQEPWIFSASIKQNILFGEKMDENKYREVLRVCALEHDISLFPFGDNTLVGENGVKLSGGQKSRINLARAVYQEADIYLLDDPLAAVDVHVAKFIMDECIVKYLKNKCVILVTHQVQFLQDVDKICVIESGRIAASGKHDDLKHLGKKFIKIIPKQKNDKKKALQRCEIQHKIKEDRSKGSITNTVYKSYCTAGSSWATVVIMFLLMLFAELTGNAADYFLTFWLNMENNPNFVTADILLYTYSVLVLFLTLATHIYGWLLAKHCNNASKNLHNMLLSKILYSSVSFFDHYSCGEILNRFSKDIDIIDNVIPPSLVSVSRTFVFALGLIVLVLLANYWLLIPTLVLCLTFYGQSKLYRSVISDAKRSESSSKCQNIFILFVMLNVAAQSILISHFIASLKGLTTIKALRAEKRLEEEFCDHLDANISAHYLRVSLNATFVFWNDIICIIYTACVIFSSFVEAINIPTANVGLAVTQSLQLTGLICFLARMATELDSLMISVERVTEYAQLPKEADDGTGSPPETWPQEGTIIFDSVTMRYSPESPVVLKNINFTVKSGEKIGIVGRTGAGKSSIVNALLRMFDFDGRIIIDDVDTKTIRLEQLRSKICAINQDPVLFAGTLRKNLDPFNNFTDFQLWIALDEVNLKQTISNLPQGLESLVSEGGSNFSPGEKQLLCLVRAMLGSSKIIIFDEATACVDFERDELIQATIQRKFKDCTVLTIAHRLSTIMVSDRILLMDGGCLKEIGPPSQLVKYSNTFFSAYVDNDKYELDSN